MLLSVLFRMGHVDSKSSRQVDLMLLFLRQNLANVLRNREFSQSFALGNPFTVIPDGFGLIVEIETQHFLGLVGSSYLFGLNAWRSAQIVNLFGNNEGVAELFLRVLFKLRGNIHI